MALSSIPPNAPNPRDSYDPGREKDTINAVRDNQRQLEGLIKVLDQFPPTPIAGSDGQVFHALARPAGTTSAGNAIFSTIRNGARVRGRMGFTPLPDET